MAILTTDAKFKKRVAKSVTVDTADLWKELHEVASFLALIGAVDDALTVWQFVYSGRVPMPDPDDRNISVFGDGAVSAVCFQRQLSDLSKGIPAPSFASWNGRTILSGNIQDRVHALDRISRERITGDAWSGADWGNDLSPRLAATAILRTARMQAQPTASGPHSKLEKKALPALVELIDRNPSFQELHPCHQAESLLLAADLSARHQQEAEAIRFLSKWHDVSIGWDYGVGEAFGLISVARLICNGALTNKHNLPLKDRQEIVTSIIDALTIRLQKPARKTPSTWKHKISVSYGQFYLEPLEADPAVVYFQEEEESEQGFSSFSHQVAFGTPEGYHDCVVESEFASEKPSIDDAAQAVIVPLIVKSSEGLYLRTVDDSGKKHRLEVPPGKYDVLARFFLMGSKRKKGGSSSWRAVLTFLPRGRGKARCLKKYGDGLA